MSPFWQFSGPNVKVTAIDWVPFATVPVKTLPGQALAVAICGELDGAGVDFKLTIDGASVLQVSGLPHGMAFVVSDATFTVPSRTPLMELAHFDAPTRLKFWARTTRRSEIKRWRIRIHPALTG